MSGKCKKVDIGFVDECEEWKLHSRFFPSKVGGKPAWLNLQDLPKLDDLTCDKCGEPCIFLCQVYAPIDDNSEAFHRTVFIFICKNGSCYQSNSAENCKVFRCQLKRDNDFFSSDPPAENREEQFDETKFARLCYVCGARGPSHCAKCKVINYCCRSHQILHWKNGHKEQCNHCELSSLQEKKISILFPQWELVIDEESEAPDSTKTTEEEEMNILKKLVEEKKAGSLFNESEDELQQYANKSVEDKTFGKFKERISRDPGQVLRYERGGTPLWITSQPTVTTEDIPNCPNCNSKRQFEFQIMPQLLNFLNLDLGVHSIDWGILAVFTCESNCSWQGPAYKKEYIFKQDIAQNVTEELKE